MEKDIQLIFMLILQKLEIGMLNLKYISPILTLIFCIVFNNPYVSVAVIIAMAYITVVKGKLPLTQYLSVLLIPITFILLRLFTIAIDFSTNQWVNIICILDFFMYVLQLLSLRK